MYTTQVQHRRNHPLAAAQLLEVPRQVTHGTHALSCFGKSTPTSDTALMPLPCFGFVDNAFLRHFAARFVTMLTCLLFFAQLLLLFSLNLN